MIREMRCCSMFIAITALVGFGTAPVLAAAPDGPEDICTNPAELTNFQAGDL
jgi:hypothetical protein